MNLNDPQHEAIIAEMRSQWKETIEGRGGDCIICDRHGKINSYNLAGMVQTLAWLIHRSDEPGHIAGWVHVPKEAPRWIMRGKTHSLLAYWGFTESRKNVDPSKKGSGFWRPTAKGRQFFRGEITGPEKMYVYDGKIKGMSLHNVWISECFKTEFDLEEVRAFRFSADAKV